MERKTSTPKKIDITTLKVINKKKLTSVYGGTAAPQYFTSLFGDYDTGDNCSLVADVDN
ncbi:hypothetical protein [Epilithonimonas hominis]|uniref:hypothetical protein n=1 Tax=Epilithonimonas hominis TaxID=420404 RepID=UPI0028981587|nr:hypothetical protein [Epilithonimonas hominis]